MGFYKEYLVRKLPVFLLVIFISCGNSNLIAPGNVVFSGSSENFNYLRGTWKRSNEKEDRETFEHWTRKNNTEYHGFGYTVQNYDTIWQEKITLLLTNGGWEYQVTGMGEEQPTTFKLTNTEKDSFTAENPENEFPKKIEYRKSGIQLIATISADTLFISIIFERLENK